MNEKIFIFIIFISLSVISCCTTRTVSGSEIDRNLTSLQNRIIELENRNKGLEEEISRLTSENKFYANYYRETITNIGTNIHSALESTDYLDERIERLLDANSELEKLLWDITNQNNSIRNKEFNTNKSNNNVK